jgi:hypothetical protein
MRRWIGLKLNQPFDLHLLEPRSAVAGSPLLSYRSPGLDLVA